MPGELPERWSRVHLGDLVVEHHDRVEERADILPLSLTKHDGLVPARERFGRALHSRDVARYRHVHRDDIVVDPMLLWDGALARLTRFDEGFVSPDYRVFRAEPSRVDLSFLEQWLRGPAARHAFANNARGTNIRRNRIGREDFLRVEVLAPPLAEQKRIAAILCSVDETIQATQAVIDQTRRVKEGLLQDLLTRGLPGRHTRFKQTEIGEVPESWDVKQLADLSEFVTSGSRGWSEFYADYGALFVRIANLSRESIDINLSKPQYVALPTGASEGTRTRLREGDVLISITADLGIVAVVGKNLGEAYVNQHIALVRLASELCVPAFVAYYLASRPGQGQFGLRNDAGAKAGLTLPSVRSVRVPVPTVAEQTEIVRYIRSTEREVSQSEAVVKRVAAIKSGLLQDLLTGKVRVTP